MGAFAAWSLRTKFLVVVVPLFLLITVLVFGISEISAHREAIEKLRTKVQEVVTIQSAVLSESMWNVADEQIELILAALAIDPDVLAVAVYDEKGNPISEIGTPGQIESSEFVASRDIYYTHRGDSQRIGTLVLALTDTRVRAELRERLIIVVGLAVFLIASLVLIALVGNRRTIGIPLERLLGSINRFRESGERLPVKWESRDEIGQVVSAFNEMQAKQDAYETELRAARDQLERRVEERTRALARKTMEMEQISNQLAKFLPPQVYESVFSGRNEVRVASTRKKLTVFFSDIAGFTETADRIESEALTDLVNHYLTEMSAIALAYGATIDKYMGDGIMIFFGDPETRGPKEDALACVRMAIDMRERMRSLTDDWRETGVEKPLKVRMGIHTGFCTVGNFGSEDRMDYTIIGGAANTASRLESMATPGEILVSYETYAHIKHEILCREHGQIDVRGMAYPLTTYVVVDAYEVLVRRRSHYREIHPNVSVELDVDAMDTADRQRAMAILEEAMEVLHTASAEEQIEVIEGGRES